MLVQLVDILEDTTVHRPGDRNEVDHREMLDIFAKADAAGVRSHRQTVFRGHQEHTQHLVQPAHPAGVDLHQVDGSAGDYGLNTMRFWHISPVTPFTGATASRMRLCPAMSSGLVGSPMKQGFAKASLLTQSMA